MLEKPIPPADGECCESGCEPCIWDDYYEQLRQWHATQKSSDRTNVSTDKSTKTQG